MITRLKPFVTPALTAVSILLIFVYFSKIWLLPCSNSRREAYFYQRPHNYPFPQCVTLEVAHPTPDPTPPLPPPHRSGLLPSARDPECERFPDTSKVLLVMKTGASEAFARVPTQLLTVLRCLPDFLIFSDMDQNIAGQQIHDSLSTMLPGVKEGNQWCVVGQGECDKLGDPAREGWRLDRCKNVHIAKKAYQMRPGY
ncbi:glycosyltransferase family 31 protein [Thermothelomyces thermophilus ATCC 42464]|uniref:Glycosyltransferase family 31 protein n=1 Tax=Thermothelomyces thermophilus (strain ATCC 42464 / BCRC 31852 / DSM 1799) TaxID=573729 RepID=G2QFT8_THET4|nr:glycosyltransferase family 31 protein [Thermothelomyces thermophilus ATCC 42464]AEO58456.1 glycosyltransferase family 31 protein [Thermothelomyces thermophilus ATCC 42464]